MMKFMAATMLTLFTITLALPSTDALAQQPPACESGAHYGDFDFWLGEWQVYAFKDREQYQGHNSITKGEGGCLLEERWTGAGGGTGFSMNFYSPVKREWRQVWVSSGAIIDYTGGLDEEGQMILVGTISYHASAKRFPFRGTWTALGDGSVRQLFEQYDPEAEAWKVWFDGLYLQDGSGSETEAGD